MTEPLLDRVITALGDQYELEGEIGRGGMSVVYRARDRRLNRPVAINVLPPELAHDPAIRTRFTREAQTSAQLTHAHIVPIYDVGERGGIAYFVMGMMTGGTSLRTHPERCVKRLSARSSKPQRIVGQRQRRCVMRYGPTTSQQALGDRSAAIYDPLLKGGHRTRVRRRRSLGDTPCGGCRPQRHRVSATGDVV
ncbi:MAG: protein kinase domain-containing protein [Gemmatimonadaceae bacterium]